MGFYFRNLLIALLMGLTFSACTAGGPFEMAAQSRMAIGGADEGGSVHFIVNPEEQTLEGVVTAQIEEEFQDRRTLTIESVEMMAQYNNVGMVSIKLNPNVPSTATVFRLNSNNEPFGTNTMTLNLIVETQDQNLTLDNVTLSSMDATVVLNENLPTLTFFFEGQEFNLQTLSFQVTIPASLITSREDPL